MGLFAPIRGQRPDSPGTLKGLMTHLARKESETIGAISSVSIRLLSGQFRRN